MRQAVHWLCGLIGKASQCSLRLPMKRIIIGINACALAMLAMILLIGSFDNDLKVQMKLTDLDRAEGIHEANFTKHYRGTFDGVRDQRFAHFLAGPWVEQWY